MLEASRREGVQSRPPSPAASPQEGSSGGELTKSLKVEAPAEKQRRVGKDVDWMRRRVQEILEEYSRKAPTAEQWPPGRRIRVRGVDIHYKVSVSLHSLQTKRKAPAAFDFNLQVDVEWG